MAALFAPAKLMCLTSPVMINKLRSSSPSIITAHIPVSAGRPFTVSPLPLSSRLKKPISAPLRVFDSRFFGSEEEEEKEMKSLMCNERLPGKLVALVLKLEMYWGSIYSLMIYVHILYVAGFQEGTVVCFKRRADEDAIYVDLDMRGFRQVKVKVGAESRDVTVEAERGEGKKREAVTHVLRLAKFEVRGFFECVLEEIKAERKKDGILTLRLPKNPASSSFPHLPAPAPSPIFASDPAG